MKIEDNGGRRIGQDRRRMQVAIDFNDRRMHSDRRKGADRRCGFDRRSQLGFRHLAGMDRRRAFRNTKYVEIIDQPVESP